MNQPRAFTLIELLIVVAIIAILAAIAVPNFLQAQIRAKVSRAEADMRTIATGLESYYVDNNGYPPGWIEIGNPSNNTTNPQGLLYPADQRFFPLTTPISYLTTVFEDPFLQSTEPNVRDRVFHYWAPNHADGHRLVSGGNPFHGAFATPDMFIDNPSEMTNYGSWVLQSAGPDGIVEPPSHMNPGAIVHTYDPTNGTVSDGVIWRFRR